MKLKLFVIAFLLAGCADEREVFREHPLAVTTAASIFVATAVGLAQ